MKTKVKLDARGMARYIADGLILEHKMEQITIEQDKRIVDTIEKAIRELDEEAERMPVDLDQPANP